VTGDGQVFVVAATIAIIIVVGSSSSSSSGFLWYAVFPNGHSLALWFVLPEMFYVKVDLVDCRWIYGGLLFGG